MSFFRRPDYQSDTTEFIEQLKAAKPGLEAEQRKGRNLLWDKTIDREFAARRQTMHFRRQELRHDTFPGVCDLHDCGLGKGFAPDHYLSANP